MASLEPADAATDTIADAEATDADSPAVDAGLSVDPSSDAPTPVTARGEVQRWLVLGPFFNPACGVVEAAEIDEAGASPVVGQVHRGRAWTEVARDCFNNAALCSGATTVDLNCHFGPVENLYAYAFVQVLSPDARVARLSVDGDDGVAVFLNGKEVPLSLRYACARCLGDRAAAQVELRAGANRLLLKVGQAAGGWGATVRFLTDAGEPMTDLMTGIQP